MEIPLPFPRPVIEPAVTDSDDVSTCKAEIHPARSVADKLYNTWKIYGHLVQDEHLWELINQPKGEDSDQFYLQRAIVQAIDALGTALSREKNIVEDFKYLHGLEQDVEWKEM